MSFEDHAIAPVKEEQIAQWLGGRSFEDVYRDYSETGYAIFERVLSDEQLTEIRSALRPHLEADIRGRGDFEGLKSNRVYAMMAKSDVFSHLAAHPLPLAFSEADLGTSCQLSAMLAINLHPGETPQPWHHDDSHCKLPRPREALQVSAFWAIDAMTEDNGATEFLPCSHKWTEDRIEGTASAESYTDRSEKTQDVGARDDAVKAVMPAGSLMLLNGLVWHRGGANRSDNPRLIITPQYCVGWMRPLENFLLATPKHVVQRMPKRARELIGYSIHPPFMGYVNGMHPSRALERAEDEAA
ncbi:MAG: phytanoyl-CoA dioxygenase family protein [Gammaproteobacteria bacterium AqS3]|nr:phytanoyl-CoA dioxygenase family protein [Gammaproteobacteria bacterium AqS3]